MLGFAGGRRRPLDARAQRADGDDRQARHDSHAELRVAVIAAASFAAPHARMVSVSPPRVAMMTLVLFSSFISMRRRRAASCAA